MAILIWILFLIGSFAVASISDHYYPGTYKLILGGIVIAGTAFLWGAFVVDVTSKNKKK